MQFRTLLKMSLDVLNSDRCIVDEDADRESQSTKRHDVDRLVQEAQNHDRCQDRERNGDRNDQCAAPTPQKYEDHQTRECSGNDCFSNHSIDGVAHKDRLVRERLNLQFGRKDRKSTRKYLPDTFHNIDRRGISCLEDGHKRATIPVLTNDIRLRRKAITDGCHIPKIDDRTSDILDRKVIELLDVL